MARAAAWSSGVRSIWKTRPGAIAIPKRVGNPANVAIGQRISDDSITLVRDSGKVLPLKEGGVVKNVHFLHQVFHRGGQERQSVLVIVICDNARAQDGRILEREIRARRPDANVVYVDPRVNAHGADDVLHAVDMARAVVVAVYIVPSAARSRGVARGGKHPSSLPDSTSALFARILGRAAEKTAVLAMGNPYLADDFPAIQNYICTFSNVTVSEISAARALFGEIPMKGQMPVNLSSAGLQTPRGSQPAQVAKVKLPLPASAGRSTLPIH